MELTICERWTQYAAEPKEEWFLDWALRSTRDAGIHLTAGWMAYQAAQDVHPDCRSAVEYFGGIGAQTQMIQELWDLPVHVVFDNSPEACRHIATNVPEVRTTVADSYDPQTFVPADIVGLDFGDLTVWKTQEGNAHRALMDRVFEAEPKVVVLTDIACRYLHLHRERYETLLGPDTCGTYTEYLDALADRLEELYGYRMIGGWWHRWSTVMALSRTGPRAEFKPTPHKPVGLEVVK